MPQQISIADARNQLTRILRQVERGEPVEITRWGKSIAVLVSLAEYDRLTRGVKSFWSALSAFRDSTPPAELEALESVFDDLRDLSPGREAPF